MVVLNPALGACAVAYSSLVARWVVVIMRFHRAVLEGDASYEYKEHFVFRAILFGRALVLGLVAPLFSFFNPAYIDQFLFGVKVSSTQVMSEAVVAQRENSFSRDSTRP